MSEPLEKEVRDALDQRRQMQFAAGFEDRVVARWKHEQRPTPSTLAHIERRAWRFVPAALAASLVLALYTARRTDGMSSAGGSIVARALGWPQSPAGSNAAPNTAAPYEVMYAALYELPQLNTAGGAR